MFFEPEQDNLYLMKIKLWLKLVSFSRIGVFVFINNSFGVGGVLLLKHQLEKKLLPIFFFFHFKITLKRTSYFWVFSTLGPFPSICLQPKSLSSAKNVHFVH
jgi:hypothetical protein